MREILFRGKRTNDGEWVEGYLLCYYGYTTIITKDDCAFGYTSNYSYDGGVTEVIPETVGQYTGLCDKNGKKIFEGDIVKIMTTNGNTKRITKIGVGICTETQSDVMSMGVYCILNNKPFVYSCNEKYKHLAEVIGNIHDNPEQLKGGAE